MLASIRAADDVLETDLQSDEILACFEEALGVRLSPCCSIRSHLWLPFAERECGGRTDWRLQKPLRSRGRRLAANGPWPMRMPDESPAAGTPAETGAAAAPAEPIHRGPNGYFRFAARPAIGR